jgi:hypothetical protein
VWATSLWNRSGQEAAPALALPRVLHAMRAVIEIDGFRAQAKRCTKAEAG